MFENHAVWLTSKRSALQLGPAPYTRPASNEIVVRNRAVAINPLDWLLQSVGDIIYPWLHYPLILGSDVAGEVVETGAAVTRFKVGDRVLGHAVGSDKDRNASSEGGFQRFTVLLEHMASPIPGNMPFEHAAVLPLGLSTAASALFQRDMLALEHPAYPAHPAKKANKTVLVWGGSTSVGCNAIQLAAAAGYKVIATASHNNREYLQELGASAVFDYRGKSAIADIVRAMKGQELAGALAIGDGAAGACVDIASQCEGNRFVVFATPQIAMDRIIAPRSNLLRFIPAMIGFIAANAAVAIKARVSGVRTKFVFGSSLKQNEVSKLIYEEFLPGALEQARYRPAPLPLVAGHGLASIVQAVALHRQGVSARKVVVTL
ncbi:MAG TPA: zinc-binding alcohol dehydrogenase family protein [Burkholderiaceae bacterium]